MARWIAVLAGLGLAGAASAVPWPLIAQGEQCYYGGGGSVACFDQAWGLGPGGTVRTLDGHVGTWTFDSAYAYIRMNFSEDTDGDGVIDYTMFFGGAVDPATNCVPYGIVEGTEGYGYWSACL